MRTLSAPTSTGATEGYWRSSTLLSNVLWGDCDDDPWVLEFIDQDDPNPGLCNASLRVHQMDENSDGLFDPVTEIDSNLAVRDVFALDFDARHRRVMWELFQNPPWIVINYVWQTFPLLGISTGQLYHAILHIY